MKKSTFAIIGTGGRGTFCFGTLLKKREDSEIVAFVEPNPVRAKKAAKELGIAPPIFHDVPSMLKCVKPDAVIVTSPDATHVTNAVAALEGDCHVLLEKPIATHVKDCQTMLEFAKRSGKILMMGFNLRHHPVIQILKKVIDEGTVGKIFMIENREFYNGGRTYMARWNGHYKISGGLWIHKGSHDFDIFQWLLGFPRPVRVSSFSGLNVLDPNHLPFPLKDGIQPGPSCRKCPYIDQCYDKYPENSLLYHIFDDETAAVDGYVVDTCIYLSPKDVHDNGITIVEYDNGAKAVHSECFVTSMHDRKYTIYGEKATVEVSLENREVIVRPKGTEEEIIHRIPPAGEDGHGGADPLLVETFVKAVRGEGYPSNTPEQGMWATACGEAAELSWRQHRMVEISELFS